MPTTLQNLAPGSRIQIRDEEWLIRRIDRSSQGNRIYGVVGLSPLVEGKEARFLEDIETDVKIIDPKETKVVVDESPFYRETKLLIESHLRATTPNDETIHLGHKGAMDVLPFQLEPTTLALSQPRQRILIADAVGLGKTIECGILLSELIKRGKGRRILVVTVKSMLTQFQKELWSRFSLPLTRLDSAGLQRVRRNIPTNHNPFHYYDKSIISIDTLKQDGEYRTHLENAYWDVIVIDEAHNVAERGSSGNNSLRSRAAKLLAKQSDSLILLSATPHDGKRESFASLMNMLNPTAIKNPKDYGPEDIDGLFIRRFKKDVKHEISGNFPERVVHTLRKQASIEEEEAYTTLSDLKFSSIDSKRSGAKILFRTLLEKALFSSPAACHSTVQERIKKLAKREDVDAKTDMASLTEFSHSLEAIPPSAFSKYQHLLGLLNKGNGSIGWMPKDTSDRIVIFTERIDTLNFLHAHLPADLKLKPDQVVTLHGGMSDIDQQEVVEKFGSADSKVRLLIASDVASEGINLHHQSHRLIHFDIPWSLLTFQQRNGRVDRYGQTEQPEIYYLLTDSANAQIRGDQRILELLIEKDEEVQNNIGDPSEFTHCHTAEEEEQAIAEAIESNAATPEAALNSVFAPTASSDDWFAQMLNGAGITEPEAPANRSHAVSKEATELLPSLYQDDYTWATEAFNTLKTHSKIQLNVELRQDEDSIDITIPKDLRNRFNKFPKEIISSETGILSLTTDRDAINEEIRRCRAEEGLWPKLHLLWEQHPAIVWMQDKLLGRFGRHQASCIHLEHLKPGERIVLATGLIPNRKGQTVVQEWYGVQFLNGELNNTLSLQDLIAHTKINEEHPNPGVKPNHDEIENLFPDAVECIQVHLSEARDVFKERTQPKLDAQLEKLSQFLHTRTEQLELNFTEATASSAEYFKAQKLREKEKAQREVQQKYEDYKTWIENSMKTEDSASIRIFSVFGNFES